MEKVPSKSIRERLSQWDGKLAPLTDTQRDWVTEMSTVAGQRPFPSGVCVSIVQQARPAKDETTPTITTAEELLSWFDEMDCEVKRDQDKIYRDYCSHLTGYCNQCDEMLTQLSSALDSLQDMTDKHQLVSEKTRALNDACEVLVEEQNKLSSYAEGISNRLMYFTELDSLGQQLTSSSSLSAQNLSLLLARLDECISFIEDHPQYKESSVYLARYRQQLSRALATVKQQVTQSLKSTTNSVLPTQQQAQGSTENVYSQYYGKFRTCAPKVKGLMKEIETRMNTSSEYSTLLRDCLQCYTSQRTRLLSPSITVTLQHYLTQYPTDTPSLVRSCCSFVSRVCLDEYQLYEHFFTRPSPELSSLLEGFAYQIYDVLRPTVIHINHLETLTDLCGILKVEIIEELVNPKGEQLIAFGNVINSLLRDAQQRLVYRTERYIISDIQGYKPSPGDLAYPDKLIVVAEARASMTIQETSDNESVFSGTDSEPSTPSGSFSLATPTRRRRGKRADLNEMHAMWYPTVRRSLMCFSKLYRCLERPVFEGLAQEILSSCVGSLKTSTEAIKTNKGQIDASLFLIKHLLILREQIAAFNVNFSVKEVYLDFTKTRTAAYNLLKKRSRIFSLSTNNSFLEFLFEGFPELIETQLDSRKEVDKYLKEACEVFISHTSQSLSGPLRAILGKYEIILDISRKESQDPATLIGRQPYLSANNVRPVVTETNKLLKTQIPQVKRSLALYLSNEETEQILFRPIRANIMNSYQSLEDIVTNHYSPEDGQIISCLSQPELVLLLSTPSAPLYTVAGRKEVPATDN